MTIRLPSTPSAEWALLLAVLRRSACRFVASRLFGVFVWSLAIVVVTARPLGSRGLPMPLRARVRAHR